MTLEEFIASQNNSSHNNYKPKKWRISECTEDDSVTSKFSYDFSDYDNVPDFNDAKQGESTKLLGQATCREDSPDVFSSRQVHPNSDSMQTDDSPVTPKIPRSPTARQSVRNIQSKSDLK